MNTRNIIDENPLSSLQYLVIGICFCLNMIDGMDVLAISYAAPGISEDWAINAQTLGIVFSAALVGMTIGAAFISPLTDKIGRRRMILFSLVIIGLGMMATSFARSVTDLVLLRLLSGLGIGSILASLTSLVSEFAPERNRNLCITVFHSGYPVGAILTGFIATWLIPEYGWRPLFVVSGMITLAMIPLVLWKLPESMDFLQTRRPPDALVKINRILARMGHAALSVIPPEADAEKTGALGVRALLVKDRIFATLMLWLAFAMSFASLYFLFSWVVTLARNSGLAMEDALLAGIAMNLGAFFGSLSLGYVSLKIGLKRTMLIFFTLAACIIIPYGFLKTSVSIILVVIFILMFFVQGSFAGLYVVAARMYPTEIRTTGIGWAIGAGRLGAIFGPSCAGFLLGAGLPISWTFVVFAIPLFLAGVTISRLKAGDFK